MIFGPHALRSLSGTLYGTLLNHRSALEALGDAIDRPPYKAAPKAPVLYLKPRNTLAADGDVVQVPAGVPELETGACLGVVIGRTACRISAARALEYVDGYLLVNDVSVPHTDYFRPNVRFKARDGFCPLGPRITTRATVANPNAIVLRTFVDGVLVQSVSTAELARCIEQLLCDVTEFMTLVAGDVLAVGAAAPAPRVRAGQTVKIESDLLGSLSNRFAAARA